MRVSTAYGTKPGAILVVLAAATIAASCAQGPATPTAPSASTATSAGAAHDVPGGQPSKSSASIQEYLLLTKTCGAVDHCTVMTSSAGPIPPGSDIYYSGPLLDARTTSRIIVTTPGGDTAAGNCSLSYRTWVGTCVLTGGTGALAGLHANVRVTSDFESDPAGVFTWEGHVPFRALIAATSAAQRAVRGPRYRRRSRSAWKKTRWIRPFAMASSSAANGSFSW